MNVGILGATGAVGREMIRILEERRFPLSSLRLFSGKRSAGLRLPFNGIELVAEEATPEGFRGLDLVLGAASNEVAMSFRDAITASGAVFIDNSSAFRMDPDVPLVVPEINPEDARRHSGVIANPNCSTVITLTGIHAIHRLSPVTDMIVATYQAASGAGQGGPVELLGEAEAYFSGASYEPKVFRHPLAFNLIPAIGSPSEGGYTTEEMKLQNEGRKILHLPELKVSCTCVRVPVLRSHSISVTLRTERPVSVEEAREAVSKAAGCRLADDLPNDCYPMPLPASDQDLVLVGRIRKDLTDERGLSLFLAGDQLRKGAATNAVQIAELLL